MDVAGDDRSGGDEDDLRSEILVSAGGSVGNECRTDEEVRVLGSEGEGLLRAHLAALIGELSTRALKSLPFSVPSKRKTSISVFGSSLAVSLSALHFLRSFNCFHTATDVNLGRLAALTKPLPLSKPGPVTLKARLRGAVPSRNPSGNIKMDLADRAVYIVVGPKLDVKVV
jgi:hypothetical protein